PEKRIVPAPAPPPSFATPPPPRPAPIILTPPPPPRPEPPPVRPADTELPAAATRSGADWETLGGGDWLNKAGVLVLVIGLALGLAYSFAHMGPGGRVAISLVIGAAMLGSGVVLEPRDRYRVFARGLIGGGWAAVYFTTYAMQALEAAR